MGQDKVVCLPLTAQVEREIRPVAYVQRMGSYKGVPALGCLLSTEAEKRMKVNEPLYDQAAIEAAVAAERERCAKLLESQPYVVLTIGKTYTEEEVVATILSAVKYLAMQIRRG